MKCRMSSIARRGHWIHTADESTSAKTHNEREVIRTRTFDDLLACSMTERDLNFKKHLPEITEQDDEVIFNLFLMLLQASNGFINPSRTQILYFRHFL